MSGKEVFHGKGVNLLKEEFLTWLREAKLLCLEIAVEHTLPYHALGTEFSKDGGLGNLKVLGGLRQGFNNLLEAFYCLLELVVLGSDVGAEGISVTGKRGLRQQGAGPVCQGAGFPHLLEHYCVHAAAVVLVEKLNIGSFGKRELFPAVRVLHVIELAGVVMSHKHLGQRSKALGGMSLHKGLKTLCGMILGKHLLHILKRCRAIIYYGMLLPKEVFEGRKDFGRSKGLYLCVGKRPGLNVLGAVNEVLLKGAAAGPLVLLGVFAGAKDVGLELCKDIVIGSNISQLILKCFQGRRKVLRKA